MRPPSQHSRYVSRLGAIQVRLHHAGGKPLGDDPNTPQDESADDIQNANNTDTPWVDQSQTYGSHASHQVFLREYVMNSHNAPVSTGKLLGGLPAGQTYAGSPDMTGGESTWAAVKLQAATKLGLLLKDVDVSNIPMLATDPYGKFLPGPHGLPQYVTTTGLVEGNLASPVPVHLVASSLWDERRRDHHTFEAKVLDLPVQSVAGRARLVAERQLLVFGGHF